jgi:uncharacterized phiE125 gp8 family phage protein
MADGPDYTWNLTTAPTLEPLTVAEAKAQIRSVQSSEDAVITSYIRAARQAAENYLGYGLLTQSWQLNLSDFVDVIPLPMAGKLASVTHVKYYDEAGAQQTLSSAVYTVDTRSRPGRIAIAADQSWPAIQSLRKVNRIEIQYVVGWTTRDLVPDAIKQGMRVLIGNMDADRDGMGTGTEQAMRVAQRFWTDRMFYAPPQFASYD